MNNKDKKGLKEDKFKFVTMQELDGDEVAEEVAEDVVEEVPQEVVQPSTSSKIKNKIHFSFEARIVTTVALGVLSFILFIFLIISAFNYHGEMNYSYDETGDVRYEVCFHDDTCQGEGKEYNSSSTQSIHSKFQYSVDFVDVPNCTFSYYVLATTRIFDANNRDKVYYRNEEYLKKPTEVLLNKIHYETVVPVDVDYYKLATNAINSRSPYFSNETMEVEVAFYVMNGQKEKKISSLVIPVTFSTYKIKKETHSNQNLNLRVSSGKWDDYNTFCFLFASFFLLICLFLGYRLIRFLMKSISKKSQYETRLQEILDEHNRMIVIARDGYTGNVEKEVVKVENFESLLSAREVLQKPIIFSKINDVKSEFIVEDEDKLYKYILKESDL